MSRFQSLLRLLPGATLLMVLTACGGAGDASLGGTVGGLSTGTGVTQQNNGAHRLSPIPVAFDARQVPLFRPTAIAVHDDGHVSGQRTLGLRAELKRMRAHAIAPGLESNENRLLARWPDRYD